MRKTILLASICVFSSVAAEAATVDLTDNSFTSVTYESFAQGAIGPIISFTETVGGVSFNFARSSGQFRQVGTWGDGTTGVNPPYAADIGGGGGSVSSFSLMTSHDVVLSAFLGLGQRFNTNPMFSVTGGSVSSMGNTFGVEGGLGSTPAGSNPFVGGPLALMAGVSYVFDVTNSGVITRGYLTGLEFSSQAVSAVPVPAALPLLAGGLGFMGLVGWRRKRKASVSAA